MPTRPPIYRLPGWRQASRAALVVDLYYKSEAQKRFRAGVLKRDCYYCSDLKCETPGRGIAAMVFARLSDGRDVRPVVAGDTLTMPEIYVSLPLSDIYADVTLLEVEPG